MKRIVFATGNARKIREIREILADMSLEVVSMRDAGISADIEENGTTYEENALIKARAVAAFTGKDDIVMAAGTFVQGASIELIADGPCREPYNVFFQGGLTFEHGRLAIMAAAKRVGPKE